MKKIALATLFSILLLVGGIFFIKNKLSKEYFPQKNYIVIYPEGDVDYKYPLTFNRKVIALNVASKFSLHFSKIYIEQKKKWVEIPYDFKFFKDQKIKIIK